MNLSVALPRIGDLEPVRLTNMIYNRANVTDGNH